jgi:hypothetical protein
VGVVSEDDPLTEWHRAALAETLKPCRELPLSERMEKREADAVRQALLHSQPVDNCPESVDGIAS